MSDFNSFPVFLVVGIVVLILSVLALTGNKVPLITDFRSLTIVIVVLGMLMCTFGRIGYVISNNPMSFSSIAGVILGIIALLIGFMKVCNIKIPFVKGDKETFILVLLIIIIKVIIMQIYQFSVRK